VVIGTIDPFAEVAGRGIEKLERGGVDVTLGVLENECSELNKRFFTFHEKKRPYIILKWAQTVDGFIDIDRTQKEFGEPTWITGDLALRLVHKIRSHESAILVGRKTAEKDNPSLTVRHWSGKNPMRLVLDRKLQLPQSLNLFDQTEKTVVFNSVKNSTDKNIELREIDFNKNIVPQILDELYKLNIQSVIVEGGKQLIESFIDAAIWDEIHLFTGNKFFYSGVKAPKISGKIIAAEVLDSDHLTVFRNS
jgi:diaminohydroxyphosphoribosylaminopyrimidine deaminase/5-amino-6-(5-phosphoribosylamino)uracil reductase